MNFKDLHYQDNPLLICNVWDGMSTKIADKLGFQAIGTSSAAISNMLGYEDGENMSFSELCYFVKQIKATSPLPLTVDIESGYSREPQEIAENIISLAKLGVAGINIEDSVVINKQRTLIDAGTFAHLLAEVTALLSDKGVDVFINVRTDVYIVGHSLPAKEAQNRAKIYQQAGADGIFVPCIENSEEIVNLTGCCELPVNVMCMPNLTNFENLKKLGVKRISMGNFLFDNMYRHLEHKLQSIINSQSFEAIF